jgi:hypothetical protein
VGIGWLNGWGIIAADTGSTLTINGSVNGINGAQSGGGANLYYNVGGTLVQNGNVSAGIGSIHKDGSGLVTLNANNTFSWILLILMTAHLLSVQQAHWFLTLMFTRVVP